MVKKRKETKLVTASMATLSNFLPKYTNHFPIINSFSNSSSPLFLNPTIYFTNPSTKPLNFNVKSYRVTTRGGFIDEDEDDESHSFGDAIALFNSRQYYKCHDVVEALWNKSQEPIRTLLHAILQCAVGFHHLFNQNHKGAMMELGEGLCKLRKMNFESGPFHQFEKEISAVLEFIYQTQLEHAACAEDFCLAMDQSERSYQLLGGFAAGQNIYSLDQNEYIVFCREKYRESNNEQPRIKIPILKASEEHFVELEYN